MALGRRGERQGDLVVTWKEMPRSPGHVFYDRLDAGFDTFTGDGLPALLRGEDGRAVDSARPVLPDAHGRLLRGDRLRARDRMALRGLAFASGVPAPWDDRTGAGSFLAVEDAKPPAA